MTRSILWFRNDLRLADNPALCAAVNEGDEVLPVLIVDPAQHARSPFGFDRSSHFRRRFLSEGVHDLADSLRAKGSALSVHVGDPAHVLARLAEQWNVGIVHAQIDHGWEEQRQERAVAAQLDLRLHAPNTLLHPKDLPFAPGKLPRVFTAFRTQVEQGVGVRDLLPEPEGITTPGRWNERVGEMHVLPFLAVPKEPRAAFECRGGRVAGLARLKHYLWDTLALSTYKETRNGLIGSDYSSKFSPWLASGALSAREILHEVQRYEARYGANESTYWMYFELLWRDFFQFTAAEHGADLFKRRGIQHKDYRGDQDQEKFAAWREGRCGHPFIDANMRELEATGWMSNRGRQCVASYLVHELGLDWRMGAYWFERMLVDYDPCSNWGNWQYLAGVGNDPRESRRFDPDRQAAMYDPEARYQALWADVSFRKDL